jgi:vacuolar-type H+-ATPase subunit H
MSSVVEQTVKALVEFEKELDFAKAQASDSKRKLIKDASSWAESAKVAGIEKAQAMAAETLAKARDEAEKDADVIRKKGDASLKSIEASVSRRKAKAVEAAVARLLGESE